MDVPAEPMEAVENVGIGPGQAFAHFITMEDLMDKLAVLNYENDFLKALKMKAPSRHYFALQTNPGEQFYMFTSLAGWLIKKCGKLFEQPQEYDDPNSTISSILDVLREFNIPVNFPPSRVKQGFGEHVIYILDQLANEAFKYNNIKWLHPDPVKEVAEVEEEVEDEAELILEKVEEEMATFFSDDDDDEENAINLEDLRNNKIVKNFEGIQSKPDEILESKVKSDEWLVELERVLPQLKLSIRTDSRDWRSHLEQMQKFSTNIDENFTLAKSQLNKLYDDISNTMEKISTREKHINNHLQSLIIEYKNKQNELKKLMDQYKDVSERTGERTKNLSKITEELENVKKEMEERGSSMTDGTPLINIKKAISKIKQEIIDLNVKTGVFENEILQEKLKDKTLYQEPIDTQVIFMQ